MRLHAVHFINIPNLEWREYCFGLDYVQELSYKLPKVQVLSQWLHVPMLC